MGLRCSEALYEAFGSRQVPGEAAAGELHAPERGGTGCAPASWHGAERQEEMLGAAPPGSVLPPATVLGKITWNRSRGDLRGSVVSTLLLGRENLIATNFLCFVYFLYEGYPSSYG